MAKAAIIAVIFSLLFIQFVHIAIFEVEETHLNSGMHDLADNHFDDLVNIDENHDDHDDSHHDLDTFHKSLHDSHNTVFLGYNTSAAIALLKTERPRVNPDFYFGLSYSPPIPPPLS